MSAAIFSGDGICAGRVATVPLRASRHTGQKCSGKARLTYHKSLFAWVKNKEKFFGDKATTTTKLMSKQFFASTYDRDWLLPGSDEADRQGARFVIKRHPDLYEDAAPLQRLGVQWRELWRPFRRRPGLGLSGDAANRGPGPRDNQHLRRRQVEHL